MSRCMLPKLARPAMLAGCMGGVVVARLGPRDGALDRKSGGKTAVFGADGETSVLQVNKAVQKDVNVASVRTAVSAAQKALADASKELSSANTEDARAREFFLKWGKGLGTSRIAVPSIGVEDIRCGLRYDESFNYDDHAVEWTRIPNRDDMVATMNAVAREESEILTDYVGLKEFNKLYTWLREAQRDDATSKTSHSSLICSKNQLQEHESRPSNYRIYVINNPKFSSQVLLSSRTKQSCLRLCSERSNVGQLVKSVRESSLILKNLFDAAKINFKNMNQDHHFIEFDVNPKFPAQSSPRFEEDECERAIHESKKWSGKLHLDVEGG
ncbi:unnamed protein product [Amoebophrya sp. A25]|nr:unnamed protein product [Amoebophrya sp. A25]|eukprot:GSA25T00018023001.1